VSGKGIEPVGEFFEVDDNGNETTVNSENLRQRKSLETLVLTSVLCVTCSLLLDPETNSWKAFGDPTEIALLASAMKLGMQKEKVIVENNLVFHAEYPFDSAVKLMTTVYRNSEMKYLHFTKGALDRLLPLCTHIQGKDSVELLDATQNHRVHEEMLNFASKGMRVLGICTKITETFDLAADRTQVEKGLTLAGIVAIYDPPRTESLPSVQVCRSAGIVVHMATGDHAKTAEAIAREVGILLPSDPPGAPLVMTATEFDHMKDEDIDKMAELPRVVARCSPATKVKLIEALHRRDKYVAMTGDGVNDAPAVKRADIGIAMGIAGSDVTKQASEITLTDDNFKTITLAVKEGRKLFANATNIAQHLLSGNVSEVIVLVLGLAIVDVLGLPVFPMSAIQILWLNMVTSSPVALALGVEDAAKDVMKFPPRAKNARIWTPQLLTDTAFYGTVLGMFSLGSFMLYIQYYTNFTLTTIPDGCAKKFVVNRCEGLFEARAVAFYVLSVLILAHGFNCRHNRYSVLKMEKQNKSLWFAVLFGLLITLPTAFIPVINTEMFEQYGFNSIWWLFMVVQIVLFMILSEIYKFCKRRIYRPSKMELQVEIEDLANAKVVVVDKDS
jgi:potassium/sodium efflux P-type ATPase